MAEPKRSRCSDFASLQWYDTAIHFVFQFVSKTSEFLLAAGIVVSTVNFLTAGAIMPDHSWLSTAWAWAQALAIDSSLGIVFTKAIEALQAAEKGKACIFFLLTALLATVAGLITHFDALAHASGLPVTDPAISGVIPLWMMTALRSVAVIGFLLASRLTAPRLSPQASHVAPRAASPTQEIPGAPPIDVQALALALVTILQQQTPTPPFAPDSGITRTTIAEIADPRVSTDPMASAPQRNQQASSSANAGSGENAVSLPSPEERLTPEAPAMQRIEQAYSVLLQERTQRQDTHPISARELAQRARTRRSTCTTWLQAQAGQIPQENHPLPLEPSPLVEGNKQIVRSR